MIILGIETSCDDTGIALIEYDWQKKCRILSNIISSQIEVHAPYGGVVPNLAARAHLKNIKPVFEKALKKANYPKINLIAVTKEPGLIPCLLVGINFAKALAYNWSIPIIEINHIKGHIYANWLNNSNIEFPILSLVVSGGHTQLVLMKSHKDFKILGETRDDAAGEAFDKVAKLLGLGYPGGPIISQRALKGNPLTFNLPRPMIRNKDYDFSFSGLKTAVLYEISRHGLSSTPLSYKGCSSQRHALKLSEKYINNMAASFQQAAIDVLISKTIKAANEFKIKTIILSGGVSANSELRKQIEEKIKKDLSNIKFQMPEIKLCTDNGAMIAMASVYKLEKNIKK